MAKLLAKELDPFKLMFIEEPVLSEHAEALKEIANHTCTPIALGERLFSRWDFKKILHDGLVDIIQPDPSHAGGITETRKIAAMAEAYDVALALHCPLGPIALAACLQLDAVCYNAVIQEQSLGIHYNQANDLLDYMTDPRCSPTDGHVAIPQGPGLGIAVNEEGRRKAARRPSLAPAGVAARRRLLCGVVTLDHVVNGMMYVLAAGCRRRHVPKDLPPRNASTPAGSFGALKKQHG